MQRRSITWWPLLLACAAALLGWVVYLPGLRGGFLFDDFGNLPILGETGPVDNWATFFRYITAGIADPTGRPLALLSFLLDARDWPADPFPFKRTSLLLHLLNAGLLMLLLRQLGRYRSRLSSASLPGYASAMPGILLRLDLAAVLGGTLWLLHPLFVSTTLYIVQREAMLPATFTMLGLLLWLYGRQTMQQGQQGRGLLLIVSGLGTCTVLALLSKANGILLPALALVIEHVWLRSPDAIAVAVQTKSQHAESLPQTALKGLALRKTIRLCSDNGLTALYRHVMWLLGGIPTVMIGAYLLYQGWSGFVHGVAALRPWTMGQRLLTEGRVLMNYLDLLWLPRPFTAGLFNDQVRISRTLLSPWTTLPSVLGVIGLIVGAWMLRRRSPALALAVLFYFVGQSMESSTLQLELYFEHRNYLPALLMFWPLSLWLCGVRFGPQPLLDAASVPLTTQRLDPATVMKALLALTLIAGLSLMTHGRAALWGNTHDQGQLWARLNPDSPRAQANAALLEMDAGRPEQAVRRLEAAVRTAPDQIQLAFNLIGAHCMLGSVGPHDITDARRAMSLSRDPGGLILHWFEGSLPGAVMERCHGLNLDTLNSLIDAGLANAHLMAVDGRRQDLMHVKGRIALARHDPVSALREFNAAIDQDPRPGAALSQAALLGAAGFPREGLAHLDHYDTLRHGPEKFSLNMGWLHAEVLRRQAYWPTEMAHLRDTLQHDAYQKGTTGTR